MPFKHSVTDSRGKKHTRVSAERQYAFAAITHMKETVSATGGVWSARSFAGWSKTMSGAEGIARRYRHSPAYDGYEIIPCTPVATGKHKS